MRVYRSSFFVVRCRIVRCNRRHTRAGRCEASAAGCAAAPGTCCGTAPANLPLWAYGYAQPGTPQAPAMPPAQDDGSPKTLPGSTGKFTLTQIRDGFGPADWHPGDHPAMPDIVARGRKDGNIRACALCHYPNGKGRAENAPVSGLPVSYFVQQMARLSRRHAEERGPEEEQHQRDDRHREGDDRRRDSRVGRSISDR